MCEFLPTKYKKKNITVKILLFEFWKCSETDGINGTFCLVKFLYSNAIEGSKKCVFIAANRLI